MRTDASGGRRRRELPDRVVVHQQERICPSLQVGATGQELGDVEAVTDPVESVAAVDTLELSLNHGAGLS